MHGPASLAGDTGGIAGGVVSSTTRVANHRPRSGFRSVIAFETLVPQRCSRNGRIALVSHRRR